jgi:hypothetical protein
VKQKTLFPSDTRNGVLFYMVSAESRCITGQIVIDNAVHYYEGLTKLNGDEAAKQFKNRLSSNDALAVSALRLAEKEAFSSV